MEDDKVKFRIEGEAYKNAIPLHQTIIALQEFHSIIDCAYIALTGIKRLSQKHRANYGVVATEFRRGSFESDLSFYINQATHVTGTLFPLVAAVNSENVWATAKASIEFLLTVAGKRSEGIEPTIKIEGDNNAPILIINGNNISANDLVINAATKAEPHAKKLSDVVKPGEIDLISTIDSKGEGFTLTEKEKGFFNPSTMVDKEVLTMKVNVFRFDKESNTGRLRVFGGQDIPPGEYSFKSVSKNITPFINAMRDNVISADILREIEVHPSGTERIASLHIISIGESRLKTLFD